MRKVERTIDPRIYKLFTRLSPQEQTDFLKDLLKIEEERVKDENRPRQSKALF
jgi:hypothetical protein